MTRQPTRRSLIVLLVFVLPSIVGTQQVPILNDILDLADILTESDTTTLRSVTYGGEEERHMWIVRDGRWEIGDQPAHVFDVGFDRPRVGFEVHAEVGDRAAARAEVDVYAPIFSQIPASLLEHLQQVEIHNTGGHAMQARRYDAGDPNSGVVNINIAFVAEHNMRQRGYLEEFALHEAAHVSWDPFHLTAPGWLEAQQADPAIISPYARDYPEREDLADTAIAWFAVRYRPERVSAHQHEAILQGIPNRLAYLDRQHFDMSPYVRVAPVSALPLVGLLLLSGLLMAFGVHWLSHRFRNPRIQTRL